MKNGIAVAGNVINLFERRKGQGNKNKERLKGMISAANRSVVILSNLLKELEGLEKKDISDKEFESICEEKWNFSVLSATTELEIDVQNHVVPDRKKTIENIIDEILEIKEIIKSETIENKTSLNQEISKMLKYQTESYQKYIGVLSDEEVLDFDNELSLYIENKWS